MNQYDIVFGDSRTGYEFSVHIHGCRDVARTARYGGRFYTVTANTPEQAIADDVEGYKQCEQNWFEDNYRILPCCKKSSKST